MTARRAILALAAVASLGGAATAAAQMDHSGHSMPAAGPTVSIGYASVAPAKLDVVTGDTVTFMNDSTRQHTASADDAAWTSAVMVPGESFARTFAAEGANPYYCKLHPAIRGEIDVHDVLLATPAQASAPNVAYPLRGRTMAGATGGVTIEADSGTGFTEVAGGGINADGSFVVAVTPKTSTTYRAVVGGKRSDPVELAVLDRKVTASASRSGKKVTVTATVSPAAPGAMVVLQLRLPERFGWWPVMHAKLDTGSKARFTMPLTRNVPARVALTLADGATRLATSKTLAIPRRK